MSFLQASSVSLFHFLGSNGSTDLDIGAHISSIASHITSAASLTACHFFPLPLLLGLTQVLSQTFQSHPYTILTHHYQILISTQFMSQLKQSQLEEQRSAAVSNGYSDLLFIHCHPFFSSPCVKVFIIFDIFLIESLHLHTESPQNCHKLLLSTKNFFVYNSKLEVF